MEVCDPSALGLWPDAAPPEALAAGGETLLDRSLTAIDWLPQVRHDPAGVCTYLGGRATGYATWCCMFHNRSASFLAEE